MNDQEKETSFLGEVIISMEIGLIVLTVSLTHVIDAYTPVPQPLACYGHCAPTAPGPTWPGSTAKK